jgi:hypothetical protein
MTTPTDDDELKRLQALKAEQAHSSSLADRFDDPRLGSRASELQAEIERFPAHIRQADAIDTALAALTNAVEDYLVARVAQFLPDAPNLWETVRRLPEKAEAPETPAEKPIVSLLAELHALGADAAALQAAVLQAESLDSYRQPAARRRSGNKDYHRVLRENLTGILKQQPQPSAAALVATVTGWERVAAGLRNAASGEDNFWTRYYRQSILSSIAVLRKLGSSDAEIEALISDAYARHTARK